MTTDDVQKIFVTAGTPPNVNLFENKEPFLEPTILPTGVRIYAFRYLYELPEFKDIKELKLGFFDNRLHLITVEYSESAVAFDTDRIKIKLSESFNLPVEAWSKKIYPSGWTTQTLHCGQFDVQIDADNKIQLTNLVISQKIKESEENKLKAFKP